MTFAQLIAARTIAHRATRAIRSFVESAAERDALNRADLVMTEAENFALALTEIRAAEDAGSVSAADAKEARKHAETRLCTFLSPDRF